MAPTLEHLFTIRAYRSKPDTLNLGPTLGSAARIVAPLTSGYLRSALHDALPSTSNSVNAALVQGGSDWLRIDPTAVPATTGHLDARMHFRDESLGAIFYVRFEGLIRLDSRMQKILEWQPDAQTTESRDHYGFVHPIVEVSREEDRWMESTAWVGHGHYVVEHEGGETKVAVEFELYRLVTG